MTLNLKLEIGKQHVRSNERNSDGTWKIISYEGEPKYPLHYGDDYAAYWSWLKDAKAITSDVVLNVIVVNNLDSKNKKIFDEMSSELHSKCREGGFQLDGWSEQQPEKQEKPKVLEKKPRRPKVLKPKVLVPADADKESKDSTKNFIRTEKATSIAEAPMKKQVEEYFPPPADDARAADGDDVMRAVNIVLDGQCTEVDHGR